MVLVPYTHADLVMDVLIVLRCDRRVWRIPKLFAIVLQVLRTYLVASRKQLFQQAQANVAVSSDKLLLGSKPSMEADEKGAFDCRLLERLKN